MHEYSSEMAQNFWTAIYAWTACFATTIAVSLSTRPRVASELTGLVYSLTPKPVTEPLAWYARPAVLATTALATTIVINVLLW
jgi:SSS family solute:Na+ symporter